MIRRGELNRYIMLNPQCSQTKLPYTPLPPPAHYFSLIPSPLPVLGGGGLAVLSLLEAAPALPSVASRSRKSCHSSASDSLLLDELAINIGSVAAALSEGVLGVRLKGDNGIRRPVTPCDVPGRARPACSFCSGRRLAGSWGSKRIREERKKTYHLSTQAVQRSTAAPQTSSGHSCQSPGNAKSNS
jgi:hypothetical protein